MPEGSPLPPASDDPSRRTQFAEERTLLAWWRTGIAAAVALAVGGILPKLSQVPRERALALGAGYGILALAFVIGGSLRDEASHKDLEAGSFVRVSSRIVLAITI
jgi:uncharacterized membrane protein YidH (DUF202 family)